jgi:hypothetical protein
MLSGPKVPHLTSTPDRMEASLTICDRWRNQIQQIQQIQTGQQSGDIPAQTEAQLYREQPGGAVVRLFDE